MEGTWFVVLEAHAHSATLYLQGDLGTREAERAVGLCSALPPGVAALRVDARGVPRDNAALGSIVRALTALWAITRGEGRGVGAVTVSLHDRAEAVTRPGQTAGDPPAPAALARPLAHPSSSITGPICASSS